MKIISLFSLLLCVQISASFTETVTFKTFIPNLLGGDSTWRADGSIPVIEHGGQHHLILDPGALNNVSFPCHVNKKDIFNIHGFFTLWEKNLKQEFKKEEQEKIKEEIEKEKVINTFSVKTFFINKEDGEIAEKQEESDSYEKKELVVDQESNPLECGICFQNTLSKKDITYFPCCKTNENISILCKGCSSRIKNDTNVCPYCKAAASNINLTLSRFNIFLNQELSKKYNEALDIEDIPFYILDKGTNIISKIEHQHPFTLFANPGNNRTPLTTVIRRGAHFQTKATKKILGVSMNKERKLVGREILYASLFFLEFFAVRMTLVGESFNQAIDTLSYNRSISIAYFLLSRYIYSNLIN